MSDLSTELQQQLREYIDQRQAFQICGGNSKAFYGQYANQQQEVKSIDVRQHRGIISYEPSELVLTARCGTPLHDIQSALDEHRQMLAFDPPSFNEHTTLGGCMAAGLSGPRRDSAGSARDFTLGMRLLNGQGENVRFGGEVMKNVAGYDVSRLMVGSLGTLGLILETSLKVLPQPEKEITLVYELTQRAAIKRANKFYNKGLPLSASCHVDGQLYLRVSGTEKGVDSAAEKIGGEYLENAHHFWNDIRDQRHDFFNTTQRLWRLSLAPASEPLALSGDTLIEWRGAQRWLKTEEHAETVRQTVAQYGGHATIFRNARIDDEVFHPLYGKLHQLHLDLKLAMDPHCLFNPGRMYPDY